MPGYIALESNSISLISYKAIAFYPALKSFIIEGEARDDEVIYRTLR